jgi:hypothetical protein
MAAGVEKRSVAMPPELAQAAELAARSKGVSFSAWVSAAVDRQLKLDRMSEAITAYESAHGEITPEEMASFEREFGPVH